MRTIGGSRELAEAVCSVLGCGAYGCGEMSVSFDSEIRRVSFGDGYFMAKCQADVAVRGQHERSVLLGMLDSAARNGAAYSSGEGLMRLIPLGNAQMIRHDERGLSEMKQRYEVVWLGRM